MRRAAAAFAALVVLTAAAAHAIPSVSAPQQREDRADVAAYIDAASARDRDCPAVTRSRKALLAQDDLSDRDRIAALQASLWCQTDSSRAGDPAETLAAIDALLPGLAASISGFAAIYDIRA
jgi:hypothetical protein